MRSNYFKNTIGGIILGISLFLGIGLMSATTAQAQYRNDDYYRRQREWQREQRRRERDEWRRQDQWGRQDQYRRQDNLPYYGGSFDLRQTALNAGYNQGIKEGRKDRSRSERFEFRDERDYQDASIDYNSRMGNRSLYQQYFRQGFANGYRDGYSGY